MRRASPLHRFSAPSRPRPDSSRLISFITPTTLHITHYRYIVPNRSMHNSSYHMYARYQQHGAQRVLLPMNAVNT
jgi:hypothetical protein